jgi:hypothetical protein
MRSMLNADILIRFPSTQFANPVPKHRLQVMLNGQVSSLTSSPQRGTFLPARKVTCLNNRSELGADIF